MITQNIMDKDCICLKKFETSPAELLFCPLHPCICLETQNINCLYCKSENQRMNDKEDEKEEKDEVEVEVYEKEQVDEQKEVELTAHEEKQELPLDLSCHENFENYRD